MEKEYTADDLTKELGEIKSSLETKMDEKTKKIRSDLDATIKAFDRFQIANKGTRLSTETMDLKSSVARSLNENTERLTAFIKGDKIPLSIEVKDMSLTSNYSGGPAALNMAPIGIVSSFGAFTHIRDIVPRVPMDKGTLPIIKDGGETGAGFGFVAEGALKPSIDFSLSEQPATAQVLAAIAVVSRQFLDDLGVYGVQSWITNKLTDLYLSKEDDAMLNGTGVSPEILGLNHAGNFTASTSSAINDVVKLVSALIQMRTLKRSPKAIIINPTDLTRVLLNVSSGSGEFDLPSYISVNDNGGLSILNVPIIDTVGQTAGRFNVIDSNGMVLGIRENLNIRFFEQDSTNVQYNKITIRAEARIAFANYSAYNVIQGFFEGES